MPCLLIFVVNAVPLGKSNSMVNPNFFIYFSNDDADMMMARSRAFDSLKYQGALSSMATIWACHMFTVATSVRWVPAVPSTSS